MQPRKLPHPKAQAVAVTVNRSIALMDQSIRFMGLREHVPSNPAIAVVRKPLVVGLWALVALTITLLIWGAFAPIESAAVAHGTVMLLSSKKTVQHLEGGVISEILVNEGDHVKAGQPLIKLNATAANANRSMMEDQLFAARAQTARLVAQRDKQTGIAYDADMTQSAQQDETLGKALAAQDQLFASENEAQQAKMAVLNQRIEQSKASIEGLKAQRDGSAQQVRLLGEELATVQTLLDKGLATKTRLFELERQKSQLEGMRGQYEAEIGKAHQAISETQMEIINVQKEFETKNSESLRDTQVQVADLSDRLRAASDVADRTTIAAPVEGVVTGLKFHTAGGVIAPGAQVMDIVPQNDPLVIEAHVKPTDIDNVHTGLEARVMFTAYKVRNMPKIPGKVTLVSADVFKDEHNPQNNYYLARIEVDRQFLNALQPKVELSPGMPAEVLVKTGSRSFLAYLFQPVTDSMFRAFREE